MLRLNRLAFLLLACCLHLPGIAQTTNCSADFSYSVVNNNAVNFFAKDTLGATHRWLFGDGTPASISGNGAITHQYAQPGKYEVKHFIEKPNSSCRDSVVETITVGSAVPCSAAFSYQKMPGTLSYQFSNNSLPATGIEKSLWNFGDGTTAESFSPVHTFANPGTYNVCLRIETNNGCSSEHCSTIQIIDSSGSCILVASYKYYKDSINCKKIYFSNTYGPASANIHFTWNFGDGTTSHDITPSHIYTQPGKYYVCLVSESGSNCRKEYCDSVIVNCENSCNINTRYEYYKDSMDCKKIHFINQPVPAVSNIHYTWNFGDGTSSHDINPAHIYSQPGMYRVCLVSESDSNCRKEYCDSVRMNCETACNITAKYEYYRDSMDCKKIHFINQPVSAVSTIHYTWNFGDGTSSHDINPAHIYSQPGLYRVCLVSEADSNCRKEYCDSVMVICETACNITAKYKYYSDSMDCKKIHFINQPVSTASNIHFTWNFGDGTSSHDISPVHIYNQPGRYRVCLVSEAGSNCRKEYCDSVTVNCANTCNLTARFETQHDAAKWNTIHFSNVSGPVNNIWQTYWTYGDSVSSRDYNSVHSYALPGLYQVCLKVIGLNGCVSSYCDTVRIVKADSCEHKAVFRHDSSSTNLIVNFEGLYQNSSAKYYWNFGDGMAGQGRNTSHVYAKPGQYNVCLTVKDDQCSATHCEAITVRAANGSGRIMLFPNPAVNTVSLDVTLNNPGQVSIRLMDGSGAVKAVYSKNATAGSNRFVLPVEKLSQGIYLVEIRTNNGVSFSRFMKG